MNKVSTTYNKVSGFISNFFSSNNTPEVFMKKTKNGFKFNLTGNRTYNFELNVQELDSAIAQALDLEYPSRLPLYGIYKNLNDLHLKSQMRTAIFKVVSEPWVLVDKNNKPNKEMTELFQKKWFEDLNEHIISTEFWGHSLIYFLIDLDTGEFTATKLFPREHVLPEKDSIIPDLGSPDKMFNYKEIEQLNSLFIEVVDTEPLGLLKDISRFSILKNFAIQDWARSSEKWGDPLVTLQSASENTEEDDRKEAFLQNFGNNGYLMTGIEDKLQLLERNSVGSSHLIYKDLISFNNDENSQGINGQTATSNEKSFVGSAEVQERILNDYTKARLKSLMYFHNEITLPFLIEYNGGNTVYSKLQGYKWMPTSLMKEEGVDKDPKDSKQKKDEKLKKEKQEEVENNLENPFI